MISLEDLIKQQEPIIRRNFLSMVATMRANTDLSEIEAFLANGDVSGALSQMLALAPNVAAASTEAFILAAQATAKEIGQSIGQVVINFDITNQAAIDAMRRNSLDLVNGFSQAQSDATRAALTEGIRNGVNPRQQARAFRDSIGLTPTQQAAVANYGRSLRTLSRDALQGALRNKGNDAAVLAAIRAGESLSESRISSMVDAYRNRMIAHRATVIARTEALRSVHEGSEAMYAQAIENGTLDADELEHEWSTAKDERVRGSHRTMHGQKRAVGDPFLSGRGNLLLYPGDSRAPANEVIQCRCRRLTRIKQLAQ